MAEKQKAGGGGIVTSRSKEFLFGSPAILGSWPKLIEPDEAFDEVKFKANFHFSEASQEAFVKRLDAAIEALWTQFLADMEKAGKPTKGLTPPSAQDWVTDHLKEPKDNWKIQGEYLQFSNDAEYVARKGPLAGETVRKKMLCFDKDGVPKDIAEVKPDGGSIVKPVLQVGLWVSPLQKKPQVSLKLQGVQVLKLETYSGAAPQAEEVSDEDLALLGDVTLTDLAGFGSGKKERGAVSNPAAMRYTPPADDDYDLDDEIPF